MKAVIWDLDGTLLDSLQDLAQATNYALALHGMPQRSLEEIRQFVGNGVRKLIERAVPEGEGNPLFETVFADFVAYYKIHCNDHTQPYPGVLETLRKLRERGVPMAIVSNKLQAGVTVLHDRWFRDVIDVAVGERPGVRRKPAPDMVFLAMRELGVSDCLYVGDSDVDIATAQAVGVPCASVLWGFRDRDFLLHHGATMLINAPEELLPLLM